MTTDTQNPRARPRTIITADPELDDLNSMIRLVLYSNDLDIEGLVYASSRYHWKGDGAGTAFFRADREYDTPRTSWRWAEGERFIHEVVDAYAAVHHNLVVHDPSYPAPEALRSVIREGNVTFEGDITEETPGSKLIEAVLLDDRPGPVHLQVWAGTSTIARALKSIEERSRETEDWESIHQYVSAKARITKFDSQDDTYDTYIRPVWPNIQVTDVATYAWGYNARRLVMPEDQHILGAAWMRENITSQGPLGALYRTWGDGRQMVEGDPTDYFHLSGLTADELLADGYQVWTEPQQPGGWISEGDSTNMLNLFCNGLRAHEHPSFGGWGGRARRTDAPNDEWSVALAQDARADGNPGYEYSVTRWFGDAQRDFAARLRWSVTPKYEDAAHYPLIEVTPRGDLTGAPGQTLTISMDVTDPAGAETEHRWWIYDESGSGRTAAIRHDPTGAVRVTVPPGAKSRDTIHLIGEATSAANPMKAYYRTIITVDADR